MSGALHESEYDEITDEQDNPDLDQISQETAIERLFKSIIDTGEYCIEIGEKTNE